MSNRSQRYLLRAIAIALLATPLPVVAAPAPMTLGGIVRTTLPGCDNPTPVRAPSGEVYSNVSDCAVSAAAAEGQHRLGQGRPRRRLGAEQSHRLRQRSSGRKLSGAVVDGGTLFLLERNLTTSGGMRVGRSASIASRA